MNDLALSDTEGINCKPLRVVTNIAELLEAGGNASDYATMTGGDLSVSKFAAAKS